MIKNHTKYLLYKKSIHTILFVLLFVFLISENGISQNHWDRNLISIYNNIAIGCLFFTFHFFDFNFGQIQEHAYLERCKFEFTTDGENYKTLAQCEVSDQAFSNQVWVNMTHKLEDTTIEFYDYYLVSMISKWVDATNQWVQVKCENNKGILVLKWYFDTNFKIKNFRVTGKWHVKGINCSDYIKGEIYNLP